MIDTPKNEIVLPDYDEIAIFLHQVRTLLLASLDFGIVIENPNKAALFNMLTILSLIENNKTLQNSLNAIAERADHKESKNRMVKITKEIFENLFLSKKD